MKSVSIGKPAILPSLVCLPLLVAMSAHAQSFTPITADNVPGVSIHELTPARMIDQQGPQSSWALGGLGGE